MSRSICISVNIRLDLENLSHTHSKVLSEIIAKLGDGKTTCSISKTDVKVEGESNSPKLPQKRKKLVPNKIQEEGRCANEPTLHIEEDKSPVIAMQYPSNFTDEEIVETEELEVGTLPLPPCVAKAIQHQVKKEEKSTLSPFERAAQKAANAKKVVTTAITMKQLIDELKTFMHKKNSVEAVIDVLKKFDANMLSEVKEENYEALHNLLVA